MLTLNHEEIGSISSQNLIASIMQEQLLLLCSSTKQVSNQIPYMVNSDSSEVANINLLYSDGVAIQKEKVYKL